MTDETTPTTTATPAPEDNLGIIERAEKATKLLEETEKRLEAKKSEYEALLARNMLSGRALGGSQMKSQDEINKETIEAEVKKRLERFR